MFAIAVNETTQTVLLSNSTGKARLNDRLNDVERIIHETAIVNPAQQRSTRAGSLRWCDQDHLFRVWMAEKSVWNDCFDNWVWHNWHWRDESRFFGHPGILFKEASVEAFRFRWTFFPCLTGLFPVFRKKCSDSLESCLFACWTPFPVNDFWKGPLPFI